MLAKEFDLPEDYILKLRRYCKSIKDLRQLLTEIKRENASDEIAI